MSVSDHISDLVARYHRCGLRPRAIARELRQIHGVDLTVSQVQMVIDNREVDESRGDPPMAALDAVLEAHLLLYDVKARLPDILAAVRRKAEEEGLDDLDVRNRCHAAAATQDAARIAAITAIQRAEAAYVASGGTRDEMERTLAIHFHTSDAGTAPTPTPGVLDG